MHVVQWACAHLKAIIACKNAPLPLVRSQHCSFCTAVRKWFIVFGSPKIYRKYKIWTSLKTISLLKYLNIPKIKTWEEDTWTRHKFAYKFDLSAETGKVC